MPIESVIRTGLVLVATSIMWAAQDPERQTPVENAANPSHTTKAPQRRGWRLYAVANG